MSITGNLALILKQIPDTVKLVVVSKTQSIEAIRDVYNYGQRIFGENKVQEIIQKQPLLPVDIEWHFLGHLQTNKVKYIAPFISLIHSVDSLKLLAEINKEAQKSNKIINCLLEMYIASEETKFGLDMNETITILSSDAYKSMENIRITGVMGMATYSDDDGLTQREFAQLHSYFKTLKQKFFIDDANFKELSMGMSGDYLTAIEQGSTIVRIGTAIFGDRNYS